MNQSIPFLGPKKIWRNWGVPPPIYGEIRQIVFETFLKSATTFPGPQERISTLDQGWSESQAIAREGMECRQARGVAACKTLRVRAGHYHHPRRFHYQHLLHMIVRVRTSRDARLWLASSSLPPSSSPSLSLLLLCSLFIYIKTIIIIIIVMLNNHATPSTCRSGQGEMVRASRRLANRRLLARTYGTTDGMSTCFEPRGGWGQSLSNPWCPDQTWN